MPILYSVISRGKTILAKYACCEGNLSNIGELILNKISPDNKKMTFSHGEYLTHYIIEDKVIYMCITNDKYDRKMAFQFLTEIHKRFVSTYGLTIATSSGNAMNIEFSKVLSNVMKTFDDVQNVDAISKVQEQVQDVKGIMINNIEILTIRDKNLEGILDRTQILTNTSLKHRQQTRKLTRSIYWKNKRMYIIIAIVIIILIYAIVSWSCGGLLWKGCLHSK